MPIKVLIADDHVFYREGVRALLVLSTKLKLSGKPTMVKKPLLKPKT